MKQDQDQTTDVDSATGSSIQKKRKRLTLANRQAVIEMFARGYTVRSIRNKLAIELGRVPSESELMQLAVEYSDDIDQAREEIAEMVLSRGLATKEERVLRLSELAENWEGKAQTEPRAANVYLKTIGQIRDEVEPLGILVRLPAGDPWGNLLTQLVESAQRSPSALNRGDTTKDPTPNKPTSSSNNSDTD